eukprot:4933567-Karenia_brevis.AAC.1
MARRRLAPKEEIQTTDNPIHQEGHLPRHPAGCILLSRVLVQMLFPAACHFGQAVTSIQEIIFSCTNANA